MLQLAFTPARLGRLALPNRFIKTATFEGRTPGGRIDDATSAFHAGFAAGGVGLTTVAYCAVAADARTFPDQLVVDEASLPALTRLADAVHRAGGAVSGQLARCGGFTKAKPTETRRPKGPSFGLNDYGLLHGVPFAPLYFREQALKVRDAVGCGVAYLGGVTSGDDVARLMRDGFDYVCVGRALLHDADFVRRLAANPGHVSACSHCNLCVATMSDAGGTRCALVG